jgi:hypothetical protein
LDLVIGKKRLQIFNQRRIPGFVPARPGLSRPAFNTTADQTTGAKAVFQDLIIIPELIADWTTPYLCHVIPQSLKKVGSEYHPSGIICHGCQRIGKSSPGRVLLVR